MKNNHPRPNWLILYLLTGAFIRALWLEANASFSNAGHIWVEIGLVLLFFGLVTLWLKANDLAIMLEDLEKTERNNQKLSQPHPFPIHTQGLDATHTGKADLDAPFSGYAGQSAPARRVAIVSYLGGFFHRPQ